MGLHDNFCDLLLVSFGAILGANIRFIIFQKFERLKISKNSIILLINTFSSFLLGLSVSILSTRYKNIHKKLKLFRNKFEKKVPKRPF